eukprot:jgi/Mesen1/8235/ME000443S07383
MRDIAPLVMTNQLPPPMYPYEGTLELQNFEDPTYYTTMQYHPDRQAIVLLSRVGPKPTLLDKLRWLDLQLSHMQCPYPIKHIEFTYTGDAVVNFVSETAMKKALLRSLLKWETLEIGTRPCTEEDIRGLYWVGISGTPSELVPYVKQALQQFGEVRGSCPPHLANYDYPIGMLKYYFVPSKNKRLPPTLQFLRPDRPKGFPPVTVRIFTPDGPLAPKCTDFGQCHSQLGCPDCYRRHQQAGA